MKGHLDDSRMRAFLDGELEPGVAEAARSHLSECAVCRRRYDLEAGRAGRMAYLLSTLESDRPASVHLSAAAARRRLEDTLSVREKEVLPMWKRLFSGRRGPVWVSLIVVIVLGLSLAVPQVRAVATGLLGTFRVQQLTILPVDTETLSGNLESMDEFGSTMEKLLDENARYDVHGETQEAADAAQASELAGYTVRLPAASAAQVNQIVVQPGVTGVYTLNVDRINPLLVEMGMDDLLLSENLNGAEVVAEIPAVVGATFGDCPELNVADQDPDQIKELESARGADCRQFMQLPSPVVTTPDNLEIDRYAAEMMVLSGMSEEEAALLSQRIDWETTLVVPVPIQEASYQFVQVDGVDATLIQETSQDAEQQYILMWVKDGMVYAISGVGDPNPAMDLANSLG